MPFGQDALRAGFEDAVDGRARWWRRASVGRSVRNAASCRFREGRPWCGESSAGPEGARSWGGGRRGADSAPFGQDALRACFEEAAGGPPWLAARAAWAVRAARRASCRFREGRPRHADPRGGPLKGWGGADRGRVRRAEPEDSRGGNLVCAGRPSAPGPGSARWAARDGGARVATGAILCVPGLHGRRARIPRGGRRGTAGPASPRGAISCAAAGRGRQAWNRRRWRRLGGFGGVGSSAERQAIEAVSERMGGPHRHRRGGSLLPERLCRCGHRLERRCGVSSPVGRGWAVPPTPEQTQGQTPCHQTLVVLP